MDWSGAPATLLVLEGTDAAVRSAGARPKSAHVVRATTKENPSTRQSGPVSSATGLSAVTRNETSAVLVKPATASPSAAPPSARSRLSVSSC